jgi:predicted dehydrogenase
MIRMGMIGCGSMARSHLGVQAALPGRMQWTGFADTDPERTRQAAQSAPNAVTATDYRDILPHVDAVVLALPHDLHHPVGMEVLKAGKHLLMEKPLALTERECLDLIALDTSPEPVLMLGYVVRHNPLWQRFGQYLREETFGKVFHVAIWTEQYTDAARAPWLGQARRLGGGQLFSHGCHYIDILLHWLGQPVSGTHAGTNLGTPWMEREGTSSVSLTFAGKVTAYHFGTWGARGSRLRYSVHAHCTEGMLELAQASETIVLHRDRSGGDLPALATLAAAGETVEKPNEVVLCRQTGRSGKAVVEQMAGFLDCIEKKQPPEISARASLRSLQVIWRLYEAEEKGLVADLRGI